MLYIYGTIFNNHDIVLKSLESIKKLPYQKIFVTDNYSTDGTYELLVERHYILYSRTERCLTLSYAWQLLYAEQLLYSIILTLKKIMYVHILKLEDIPEYIGNRS